MRRVLARVGDPAREAGGGLRNVAGALRNGGAPEAVPALVRALDDPEPLVHGHTAWALGRIGSASALAALTEAMSAEMDRAVIEEITAALAEVSAASLATCLSSSSVSPLERPLRPGWSSAAFWRLSAVSLSLQILSVSEAVRRAAAVGGTPCLCRSARAWPEKLPTPSGPPVGRHGSDASCDAAPLASLLV